jgi:hypothetical protein
MGVPLILFSTCSTTYPSKRSQQPRVVPGGVPPCKACTCQLMITRLLLLQLQSTHFVTCELVFFNEPA